MKRVKEILVMGVALAVMSGCAGSPALKKDTGTSMRNDVFEEVAEAGSVPQGHADLRLTCSLKTHKPGIYSAKDPHGTERYFLLLNIDGQAVQLQGNVREENIEESAHPHSDTGVGMRYRFSKNLRLKAGTHRLRVALPADGIVEEREITLPEGAHTLVVEPVYRGTQQKPRPGFYGDTSFKQGIAGLRVVLNGQQI